MFAAYRVHIEGVKNVDAIKEMRFIGDCGLKPTKNILWGYHPNAAKIFGAKLRGGHRN
jgi:hypothetical protein